MRLSIISKSGPQGGGASTVAAQLSQKLGGGIEVDHWGGEEKEPSTRLRLHDSKLDDLTFRATRFGSRAIGYSDFFSLSLHLMRNKRSEYDLIHVHDISGVLSPFALTRLSAIAPVVWTFHDCSPFTGGCIYPLDCATYTMQCGSCPQLSRWPLLAPFDNTKRMRRWRHAIVNKHISAIICPSHWMAEQARLSGIKPELMHVIHNSVDTEIFHPLSKPDARAGLSIPDDAFAIFLGSATFNNPYKGIDLAFRAISALKEPVHVLLAGKNVSVEHLPPGPVYHSLEYTSDRAELARRYGACDVTIFPSLAENFPLMLLESMACGTPVIAFSTGGIPEAVDHEVNGWLAPTGDIQGLINGLQYAMNDRQRLSRWSSSARQKVMKCFTEDRFLDAHLDLYEELISTRARNSSLS